MNLSPRIHCAALLAAMTGVGCSPSAIAPDAGTAVAPRDAAAGGAADAGAGGAVDAPATPATDAARTDVAAAVDAPSRSDAGPSASDGPSADRPGWTLVWSDEFDVDGPPNPADWNFEHGFVRNQELQWYQPDNATCSGGLLVIEARREEKPNPNYQAGSSDWKLNRQNIEYTSSSMTTSGKHAFLYGRFEMRARIATDAGSWPAFWALGSGVSWPASGEVDIMEYYRNMVLANVCRPSGSTCNWTSTNKTLSALGGSTWTSQFHVWAMEWDAQNIDLYLDDTLVNHFVVANAVASGQTNPYMGRTFYILVNQAVGGQNGGDPTNTTFPLRYEVDYVRVYQRAN
jgi:beta-glucanase (GH16 family)